MTEIGTLLTEPSMASEIQASKPERTSSGIASRMFSMAEKLGRDEDAWRMDSCKHLDSFTMTERCWLFEQKVQLKSSAYTQKEQSERSHAISLLEQALDDFYERHHANVCSCTQGALSHSIRCSKNTNTHEHHPFRDELFNSRRDL